MKTKIVFFSSELKDSLISDGALPKELVCAIQIGLIVLNTFFSDPDMQQAPHSDKFSKNLARKKHVASFQVKVFRQKNKTKIENQFYFPAPQSLNLSCWSQNALCKNRARSNYLTRSLNRHQFLSININSTASWNKFSMDSACKVHMEIYIFSIERFSEKKIVFFWHTLIYTYRDLPIYFYTIQRPVQ